MKIRHSWRFSIVFYLKDKTYFVFFINEWEICQCNNVCKDIQIEKYPKTSRDFQLLQKLVTQSNFHYQNILKCYKLHKIFYYIITTR